MPEVDVRLVAQRPFAGVRRTCARADIPRVLIPGLDVVWAAVRAHAAGPLGHNIALYRELGNDRVELMCGVEVEPPFADVGEVGLHWTPAGTVIHARQPGGPEHLPATYGDLHAWLQAHDSPPLERYWEDYDDVDERGSILGIDVFMLLPDGITPGPYGLARPVYHPGCAGPIGTGRGSKPP